MLINSLKVNSKHKKVIIIFKIGKTFAMIKPDCYMNAGKIINII